MRDEGRIAELYALACQQLPLIKVFIHLIDRSVIEISFATAVSMMAFYHRYCCSRSSVLFA